MLERRRPNTWETKIIPGKPNQNFKRMRPSTWNLGYVGKVTEENKEAYKKIGTYGPTNETAYLDEKTGLYFVENDCCPHSRKYINKTKIIFS